MFKLYKAGYVVKQSLLIKGEPGPDGAAVSTPCTAAHPHQRAATFCLSEAQRDSALPPQPSEDLVKASKL